MIDRIKANASMTSKMRKINFSDIPGCDGLRDDGSPGGVSGVGSARTGACC